MKRLTTFIIAALVCLGSVASGKGIEYHDCSKLNIIGKIMDAPNPYHRVDTSLYKGLNKNESYLGRCPAGLAVSFRTDSRTIMLKGKFGYKEVFENSTGLTQRGYDLYCLNDGKWIWASVASNALGHDGEELKLIRRMEGGMKQFLLYLPLYSELLSLEIGIDEGSVIEAAPSPFLHRIIVYGSSYTQGCGTSRPGLSYPQLLSRRTGLHFINLGLDGNCKMQPQFADMLADATADAFLFDVFSNGSAGDFEKRLFPMIEKIQAAHPGKPLIFQQTIMQESLSLKDSVSRAAYCKRLDTAEQLMSRATKKYKDVYFIKQNTRKDGYATCVDGVHPNDTGYAAWVDSIENPLMRILAKYGIKRVR